MLFSRNRFLYGFMFVYIIILYIYIIIYIYIYLSRWRRREGSLTLLSFHSLCLHLRSHLTKWEVFQNTSS